MAAKLARFSWLPGGLTAAAIIALGRLTGSTSSAPLDLPMYDWALSKASVAPSRDIVVVAIDQSSIARLGPHPWPLATHARLVDRLRLGGVRVIAFTEPPLGSQPSGEVERIRAALALLESSKLGDSQQARELRRLLGESEPGRDAATSFAQAARTHGNVVVPVDVSTVGDAQSNESALPPGMLIGADIDVLNEARSAHLMRAPDAALAGAVSAVGHVYREPDTDGIVRTDTAALRLDDRLLPSLATAVVARARSIAPDQIVFGSRRLHLGDRVISLEPSLKTRPHYFAVTATRTFTQVSYSQVLDGEIPREQLQDKIILIGVTAPGAMGMAVATPTDAASPSVLATASVVSSLLEDSLYTRSSLPATMEWVAAVAVVLFAAFALPHIPLILGAIATGLLIAILAVSEVGLLQSTHTWMRLMLPAAALLVGFAMYALGEFIRRANTKVGGKESAGNLRALGQTFQRQGQLDLAFETYRRCPLDAATMELLYYLGADFERRRQMQKAEAVYGYIATREPNYRDLRARRARVRDAATAQETSTADHLPRRAPPVSASRIDDPAATDPALPARTLGRYQIERELGKGAMGVVYLGRDPKINRVVAIKAIPLAEEFPEEDLAEARARFFREAEMAGRLNHPAIVTVHDAGEDQGLAYIAMEYLRGQHLSHFTDSSRLLPPRTVMLLMARVADALHYAHRQNVVHRDIKPANIMYNPDTDELKITDFGIARLTDTSRTKTGIVLGTPSFMSPEQLEGRNLDGRSDQFALGVSLFQLLCGHLPFRADSMPRLMQKIATEPHASVRLVRPDLPEGIDAILDRALAKSADDRYPTCAELAAALRACAGPEEKTAAQPKHEWLIP